MAFIDKTGLQHLWGHTVERLNEKADIKVVETLATRVPEVSAAHQQLVTDGEGNAQWEEKLCWDDGTVITTLVDNVSVTLADSYGSYAYIENPFKLEIIEGKEYIVIWNGTSYTCTAYMDSYDCLAIGNEEIITTGQGDGAPFFVETYNGSLILYTSTTGTYTITIQTETENIHKIAPKYVHTPDWNAKADEAGYIANRTHWEETQEGAIINNLSFSLSQSGNYYTSEPIPYTLNLSVGSECTVIWDGNSYNLTANYVSYGQMFLIGNDKILGLPDAIDTGEPFIIKYLPNSATLEIYCTSMPASQVLTVYVKSTTIHKLDPKYLPNEAFYTHPTYTARTGAPTSNATPSFGGTFTISQVTSNSLGHVTNLTNRTVRIPSSTATTSTAGLMSAADKTKLDGLGASDWNQNDETAADYIKNRTHWIENPQILVDNVTVTTTSGTSLTNPFTIENAFVVGTTYIVTWNGTQYECVAYNIPGPGHPSIGSASFISQTGGNEEPFLMFTPNSGTIILFAETGTHILSLAQEGAIHKIDNKYLNLPDIPQNILDGSVNGSVRTSFSMAEGTQIGLNTYYTIGVNAASFGANTKASGQGSFAEGISTTASGYGSHAEGISTVASGNYSHAEGCSTTAKGSYQHVQGRYNIEDISAIYAHIIGNGESDTARSNAHTLDWSGNAWFKGSVYVGGTGQTDTAAIKILPAKLVSTETTPTTNDTICWLYE